MGWARWSNREPAASHYALSTLSRAGRSSSLITQNVDRLHHKASHAGPLIELHGTTHVVQCLDCGAESCREEVQARLNALNPAFPPREAVGEARPDGDVELAADATAAFSVAACLCCGGRLKPRVVFFGDTLQPAVAAAAKQCAEECDALLIVGSSMRTWSAYRLASQVAARGKPIAILSIGESRADPLASLRIQAVAGEALQRAIAHGGLDLPALS